MRVCLTGRQNTALLTRLLAETRALDARLAREEAMRQLRERNEDLYLRALRRWFGETEPAQ